MKCERVRRNSKPSDCLAFSKVWLSQRMQPALFAVAIRSISTANSIAICIMLNQNVKTNLNMFDGKETSDLHQPVSSVRSEKSKVSKF